MKKKTKIVSIHMLSTCARFGIHCFHKNSGDIGLTLTR